MLKRKFPGLVKNKIIYLELGSRTDSEPSKDTLENLLTLCQTGAEDKAIKAALEKYEKAVSTHTQKSTPLAQRKAQLEACKVEIYDCTGDGTRPYPDRYEEALNFLNKWKEETV